VSTLNTRSDCTVLSSTYNNFLTDDLLQSADKDQQESRAVAEKLHDAIAKFDTHRNLQPHRAVLPAIARLSLVLVSTKLGDS